MVDFIYGANAYHKNPPWKTEGHFLVSLSNYHELEGKTDSPKFIGIAGEI
jgi:hypothetical protein